MLYSLETKGALLYLPIRQVMCGIIKVVEGLPKLLRVFREGLA